MKAKSHIAMLTASCLLLSMLLGGAASADSVTVTADRLNIRKDANAASKIIDTVDKEETLSFVSGNGDWYQVKNGSATGFVLKDYVELDSSKMEEDIQVNTETFSEAQAGRAAFRLNMRALPTTNAKVVSVIPENGALNLKGRCGIWYVAEYGGKTGYVMAQYVTLDGDTDASTSGESIGTTYSVSKSGIALTDVKLRQSPSTSSSVEKIIDHNDSMTILGESGSFYKVSINGKEGYAAKAYISVSDSNDSSDNLTVYDSAKNALTTDRVNVRREPSLGASILLVVGKNESVTVTGETDSWYKVSVSGKEGYISKSYIAINAAIYDTPKAGTTTEEVNLRAEASTTSDVLKIIKGNRSVSVTAKADTWYKVTVDGLTGYMKAEYVRISETVSDEDDIVADDLISYTAARDGTINERVNLRQSASTSSSIVRVLEKDTSISLLGEQNGFYQVKSGTLFGYVAKAYVSLGTSSSDTPTETENETDSSVTDTLYSSSKNGVTTVTVNMRRTPEGDILFTLPSNTRVTLLGEAGAWYKVSYSNSTGYIAKAYVSEELVVPSQPDSSDDDSQTTVSGDGTTGYITGSSVNMRRGAGTNYGIIKVLKYGAEVTFYSLTDGWYLIKSGDETGYLSSKYISTTKPESSTESSDTVVSTPDPGSGKVQMADWFTSDISKIFAVGDIATVTDVDTGLSWQVMRSGGSNHADVQPLTAEDTAKMKEAYGGTWSWNRRAIWVTVDGVRYAASMNGMPHGTGSIKTNNFDGHHCIHFLNSRTHTGNRWDTAHQSMVQKAYAAGQ